MSRLTIRYDERLGGHQLDATYDDLISFHCFCQMGSVRGELHVPGHGPFELRDRETNYRLHHILSPITAGFNRFRRAA